MKKQDKNKENSKSNIEPMGVDEFKFILNKMRLKQKNVILQSDFTRVTLYYDMQESIRTKTPSPISICLPIFNLELWLL